MCLQRRKQFAVDAESHTLLGDAEVLTDTYESARKLSAFRAAELADELHISLPNANNRLKRLLEAGALRRERSAGPDRGCKEFIYSVPAFGGATGPSPHSCRLVLCRYAELVQEWALLISKP